MKGFLRWLCHSIFYFGRPGRLHAEAMSAFRAGDLKTAEQKADEWLALYGSKDAK